MVRVGVVIVRVVPVGAVRVVWMVRVGVVCVRVMGVRLVCMRSVYVW